MCGIAGWVSTRAGQFGPEAPAVLAAMQQAIAHRGPDDSGQHFDPPGPLPGGAALGFRRLSIVDLGGGHQPMCNEDGQVWVVFNGEIYNHRALRRELEAAGHVFASDHCDTEVLVHGWEQWGTGLLPKLSGMFDFAVWDGHKRRLLLARDRHGKKPLFVGVLDRGQTLVFGTELAAVVAHPAVPRRLDPLGLQALVLMDYVPSPRSMLQDVAAVEPGTWWLWQARDDGTASLEVAHWHTLPPIDPDLANLSEAEALTELDQRLHGAVERRLMADVPLGVFLSGGIDSSLVAAYAARLRPDLQTFSIGFEDKSFDESSHARAVARHLGTRHHERTFDPQACLTALPDLLARMDQPLADASILPTWFLCGFARPDVTVALGGDGGDEWWLGYPTFYAHRLARLMDVPGLQRVQPWLQRALGHLPVSQGNLSLDFQLKRFVAGLGYAGGMRHVAWIGGLEPRQLERVLHPDLLKTLANPLDDLLPRVDIARQIDAVWQQGMLGARDDADALAWLYARFYLADGVLQKVDRASMLHGLEVRAPLLDDSVVELARSLPTSLKLRGRTTKVLLRKLAARQLPAAIVQRPKKGFGVPMAAWLRGPLRAWMLDVLAPAQAGRLPWLNGPGVAAMVQEHLDGRADHRKTLWALLCFCTWQARVLGPEHG
jgi:asparagine synthase (glutamine-hydrolysing)